jgi:hypothetical protein
MMVLSRIEIGAGSPFNTTALEICRPRFPRCPPRCHRIPSPPRLLEWAMLNMSFSAGMRWRRLKPPCDAAPLLNVHSAVASSCRHAYQLGTTRTSLGPRRFSQIPGCLLTLFDATRRINIVSAAVGSISNLQPGRGVAISSLSLQHPFRRSGTRPEALPVVAALTRRNARWHSQTTTRFPQDPFQDVRGTSLNPLSISHFAHTPKPPPPSLTNPLLSRIHRPFPRHHYHRRRLLGPPPGRLLRQASRGAPPHAGQHATRLLC